MNLLNKLTIKNLKLNKKRTIVTIIGIMLSVALITAVATMYSSMIKSLINYETYEKGYFHVAYYNVPINEIATIKNTRGVEETYLACNIGYAKLENSKNEDKPYAFVKGFTKSALENLSVKLTEGRLPENENEIVIPTHLKTNGRITMNVGDNITLNVGTRMSNGYELNQNNPYTGDEEIINTTTKTYTIVGIIERPATNIEDYSAPGYTFITYMNEDAMNGKVDVYAKYSKEGSKDYISVTSSILNIDKDALAKLYQYEAGTINLSESEYNSLIEKLDDAKYDYNINSYLITLENNPFENSTTSGIGIVVVIVIIIIIATSVFCIKNSFDISITEKIKQYGMLRSIGATKKQIKKNVFYEATILGIIGIPLGILLGLLASYILIIISNIYLKDMLAKGLKIVLSYSWVAFVIAIVLGFVTIYLSALRSSIKASKISPIDSIKNSGNIKINYKKVKSPKIIKRLFKIGGEISYKNIKRNKKKYRTTVISVVTSVAVFIGLSYFISSAFEYIDKEINVSDYNIELSTTNGTPINKLQETVYLDDVEEYAIYKETSINTKTSQENYNKEYFDITYSNIVNSESSEYENDTILIYIINDEQFKNYVKSLGLNYDDVKEKGILNDTIRIATSDNKDKTIRKYAYKSGNKINGLVDEKNYTFEIAYVTNKQPFGLNNTYNYTGELILSSKYYMDITKNNNIHIYYKSSDPNKLQDDIDEVLKGESYNLTNIEENAKMMRNLYTLVAIFLYGFIIVVSLIGVTNIFNTITTNMELRKQEFAMLKSIGMTKHEFNYMVRMESIFIGLKSLIIGIPLGIGIAYIIYKAIKGGGSLITFKIPILAIIVSIIVVYLLITILMQYSMNKINKQNTIETIRNENI